MRFYLLQDRLFRDVHDHLRLRTGGQRAVLLHRHLLQMYVKGTIRVRLHYLTNETM